jgi:hypothetical protein
MHSRSLVPQPVLAIVSGYGVADVMQVPMAVAISAELLILSNLELLHVMYGARIALRQSS